MTHLVPNANSLRATTRGLTRTPHSSLYRHSWQNACIMPPTQLHLNVSPPPSWSQNKAHKFDEDWDGIPRLQL